MPSVILKKGREHRLYAGHSWVYAGEIAHITGEPKQNMTMLVLNHIFNNGKVSIMDLASTVWTAWRAL